MWCTRQHFPVLSLPATAVGIEIEPATTLSWHNDCSVGVTAGGTNGGQWRSARKHLGCRCVRTHAACRTWTSPASAGSRAHRNTQPPSTQDTRTTQPEAVVDHALAVGHGTHSRTYTRTQTCKEGKHRQVLRVVGVHVHPTCQEVSDLTPMCVLSMLVNTHHVPTVADEYTRVHPHALPLAQSDTPHSQCAVSGKSRTKQEATTCTRTGHENKNTTKTNATTCCTDSVAANSRAQTQQCRKQPPASRGSTHINLKSRDPIHTQTQRDRSFHVASCPLSPFRAGKQHTLL